MPAQEPHVGQQLSSIAFNSFFVEREPAWYFPTASNTVLRSRLRPSRWPACIGAAADQDRRNIEAIAAMSMPGTILSQPGMQDECVKGMGYRHRFDGVGDQLGLGSE